MVDHFLPLAGKGVLLDKAPGRFLIDVVTHYLDLLGVTDPQTFFVRQPDELDGHGVKALQLGRDGVDGHLVG